MEDLRHNYRQHPDELSQELQVKHSMNRAQRRTANGKLLIAEAKIKDLIAENKRLKGELE
jgi:hypothetical protein